MVINGVEWSEAKVGGTAGFSSGSQLAQSDNGRHGTTLGCAGASCWGRSDQSKADADAMVGERGGLAGIDSRGVPYNVRSTYMYIYCMMMMRRICE